MALHSPATCCLAHPGFADVALRSNDFQRGANANAVLHHFEHTWHKSKGTSYAHSAFLVTSVGIGGRQSRKILQSKSAETHHIGLSIDFNTSTFFDS